MSYEYLNRADEALETAGFHQMRLEDFDFPTIQENMDGVTPYRFASFNDTAEAKGVVFVDMPYSNNLGSANMMLRLATQQMALGNDYAVVGVETYNPKDMKLDAKQRHHVTDGDFSPLSDRMFSAVAAVNVRDDQDLMVYGYSKAGAVGLDMVHRNYSETPRGFFEVTALGAFDPVRMGNGNLYKMYRASGASTDQEFDNVMATDSVALLEAKGLLDLLSRHDRDAKKDYQKAIKRAVAGYMFADPLGNLALTRGFATDVSIDQLQVVNNLHDQDRTPMKPLVGVLGDSHIVPPAAREFLQQQGINWLEIAGLDHSAADNLRYSAAFMLHTVATSAKL